jgi:hypothetical protein
VSRRIKWGAMVRGVVGYGVFIWVVEHFLNHPEPYNTADLIRVALGIFGLQAGLGKESIVSTIDAASRFMQAIPSWWRRKTMTTEHPVPLFPPREQPAAPAHHPKPKRKRPPKGSIAHRSTAKGKATPAKDRKENR